MYFPSKFDCYDKPKKKKKIKAKKFKGKKIKKSPKPFKKGKKFFEKKKKGGKKDKDVTDKPIAKQIEKRDCRCWKCNEKGHFANECPKQLNFARIYSNELFEQIAGYDEISYFEIESEDEILVLTYLSSSDDGNSDSS